MKLVKNETLRYTLAECWLGQFILASSDRGVRALFLGSNKDTLVNDLQLRFPHAELVRDDTSLADLVRRIQDFAENLDATFEVDLDILGTPFQKRVWAQLREIPCGSSVTYGALAERLGNSNAYRAVANACGANPVSIIVPCHRVIRNNGEISGYRWGVEIKKKLLDREAEMKHDCALKNTVH